MKSTYYRTDHRLVTLTLNFHSFFQGPGYFRFKNSYLKDGFFTPKLENANKEIVIANFESLNLKFHLRYLERKHNVRPNFFSKELKKKSKKLVNITPERVNLTLILRSFSTKNTSE